MTKRSAWSRSRPSARPFLTRPRWVLHPPPKGLLLSSLVVLSAALQPLEAQTEVRAREVPSGSTAVLQAISPVDDDTVWVSGHGGAILRSSDGGQSWLLVPGPAGDSLQLRDVHALSWESAVVLSAGEGPLSRIYRTDDAGSSWDNQFLMDDPRGFLDCLAFWDQDRGFAYGDSFDGRLFILVTDDGGKRWRRPDGDEMQGERGESGEPDELRLPPAGEGEGGFAASGSCAQAGSRGKGWIGTGAGPEARLLETDDFGLTWTSKPVPLKSGPSAGVFTIAMAAGVPRMILGGDLSAPDSVVPNAVTSADDGATWTPTARPSPISGAVYGSAAPQVAGRTWIFAFAPTSAAYTRDGGANWHPIAGVSAWAGAFGPSGTRGWAVGAQGRIWRLDIGR